MQRTHALLVTLSLLVVAFAGCFGSDDEADPAGDAPPVAQATDETGAIQGTLVTTNLEPAAKALVGLVQGGTVVQETQADDAGRFVLNGIEPGTYRVQVSAVCCKPAVRDVTVTAGEVTPMNLQLDLLSSDDLATPYSEWQQWNGMISCAVAGVALCGIQGDFVPELQDPNDRFMTEFELNRGVKSFLVGIQWDATGGTAGKTMNLLVENDDCGATACSYRYADLTGESPLVVRIDNDDITDEEWKWDTIEDNRTLQFRVFPGELTDVMYQQAFTVYYEPYYWAEAPEDASVLPDG